MKNINYSAQIHISERKGILVLLVLSFLIFLPAMSVARGLGATEYSSPNYDQQEDYGSSSISGGESGLSEFVEDAYGRHGNSEFGSRVQLEARVVSSVLAVSDHHHRVIERIQPKFEGYFMALSEPSPHLEYVDAPFFSEDQEYSPEAPLKEMVILEVSGEIGFTPLNYEAFIFRFVSPEGSCQVKLSDPVFPGVNDFSNDELLAAAFPGCEGPQAARQRALLEAVPGLVITGYDEATGVIIAKTAASSSAAYSMSSPGSGTTEVAAEEPADGCKDYQRERNYGYSSSEICSDMWWGYGNWVRGGSYRQSVTCIPEGHGCTVQTVDSGDDLHSSIRPAGWGSCTCCNNYGATVTGNTASAHLVSSNGTTGGHVAIAKSVKAWRTSTSSSMTALELEGQCGGDLDMPLHGSTASASGAIDYQARNTTQTSKAEVGGWDADNISTHLCKPNKQKREDITVVIAID